MNSIFGIGPLELFFIAVIALVVLGPERLPGVIREGMKHFRTLRNMSGELTSQFSEELKALDDINPQKIMNEMMQDLDMEEERKVLSELNPKKIRNDISDSVNPKKILTKKAATEKAATEKAVQHADGAAAETKEATATAGVVAATTDTPVESTSVPPKAEDTAAADSSPADDTVDAIKDASVDETVVDDTVVNETAPAVLTTAEIMARSQPKMSNNPYTKSSKKTSKADDSQPEPSVSTNSTDIRTSDLDEPVAENRIAPDELAANIEQAEAPDQTDPATVSANGTHREICDETHDETLDETHESVEDSA